MPDLPWELIRKIIGYTLDPSQRPYLDDIRTMQSILPRGVNAALVHLREMQALRHAYTDYPIKPFRRLYEDCWHLC